MNTEQFEWISGYEGRYSISTEGRVFSHLTGDFRICTLYTRKKGGNYKVNLTKANRTKTHRIKRLVADTFIPNPDNKREIININGDPTDCRVANLKRVTASERFYHVFSDNDKLTNLKNATKIALGRPVINDRTKLVYPSGKAAESLCKLQRGFVTSQINGKAYKTNKKYQFRYLNNTRRV